ADAFEIALGGRLHDDLTRNVLAGESNLVYIHVTAEGISVRRAEAVNDIDHTVRKPGFLSQGGDAQSRQRGLLGRLEHGRATGRQRRSPFPCLHQQWEVPGNDLADNTDRLVARIAEIISLHRNRLT